MTTTRFHDYPEPFTPRPDRAPGFYRRSSPPEANAAADDYTTIRQALVSEMHAAEPAPVEIPAFLEVPGTDVMQTLEEAGVTHLDTYERVNTILVQALAAAKGSAELARVYGGTFDGRSVVDWERKAQAINESIRWNSGRRAETL